MAWYESMPEKRLIFVDDLEVWVIEKKRLKQSHLRVQPDGRIDVSVRYGTSDDYVADFVRDHRDWIEAEQKKTAASPMGRAATASKEELREWRQAVEFATRVLLERWEPVMGVKAGQLAFRKMKTRWGSCQPSTGRICINIVLALYPPDCLEYVVVHELCHLIVPGHGEDFHALMDRYLPDWRQRRAKLR